jgi:hypothetical protein
MGKYLMSPEMVKMMAELETVMEVKLEVSIPDATVEAIKSIDIATLPLEDQVKVLKARVALAEAKVVDEKKVKGDYVAGNLSSGVGGKDNREDGKKSIAFFTLALHQIGANKLEKPEFRNVKVYDADADLLFDELGKGKGKGKGSFISFYIKEDKEAFKEGKKLWVGNGVKILKKKEAEAEEGGIEGLEDAAADLAIEEEEGGLDI